MSSPHAADLPQAESGSPPEGLSRYFTAAVLDDAPRLLEDSYHLRYQVYCHERHFLSAERYPDALEVDAFDRHSVHMGVLNLQGQLVATTRLVQMSVEGLPMFAHCTIDPEERFLHRPETRAVEISRLSVSRAYNRRRGDDHFGLAGPTPRPNEPEQRRGGGEIVMTLYKEVYQTSKRRGFTHWLAATEKSLQRLLARSGFPFRRIGPLTDYYGPVAPYVLDLAELDGIILSGERPLLSAFLDGLEPEFRPAHGTVGHGDDRTPSPDAQRRTH